MELMLNEAFLLVTTRDIFLLVWNCLVSLVCLVSFKEENLERQSCPLVNNTLKLHDNDNNRVENPITL